MAKQTAQQGAGLGHQCIAQVEQLINIETSHQLLPDARVDQIVLSRLPQQFRLPAELRPYAA